MASVSTSKSPEQPQGTHRSDVWRIPGCDSSGGSASSSDDQPVRIQFLLHEVRAGCLIGALSCCHMLPAEPLFPRFHAHRRVLVHADPVLYCYASSGPFRPGGSSICRALSDLLPGVRARARAGVGSRRGGDDHRRGRRGRLVVQIAKWPREHQSDHRGGPADPITCASMARLLHSPRSQEPRCQWCAAAEDEVRSVLL